MNSVGMIKIIDLMNREDDVLTLVSHHLLL